MGPQAAVWGRHVHPWHAVATALDKYKNLLLDFKLEDISKVCTPNLIPIRHTDHVYQTGTKVPR